MKYSLNKWKQKLRKKEYGLLLYAGLLALGLGGCSAKLPQNLFTDSGTNVVQQIDTSQYLDLSLLEKEPSAEDQTWNGYEVFTLEYGTFETPITNMEAKINMVEISPVSVEFEDGTMYLLEMVVSRYSYVEKGDVLAKVSMETSSLDLEEMQLKLLRLEQEYAEYLEEYTTKHEEAVANVSPHYEMIAKVDNIKIAQMELDHSRKASSYEKQLTDYRERIEAMQKNAGINKIVAPKSGFVLAVADLKAGQELRNGDWICSMAPSDKLMLEFTDETMHYGYGMDLQMLTGDLRLATPYEVKAVSALGKVLYGNWDKTRTKIAGDYDMADLMKNRKFVVTGTTNVMKNVLVLPKEAVTKENQKYFVTILHEDQTLEKKQFLVGGENNQYYWVYEGLEAGMKIVLRD